MIARLQSDNQFSAAGEKLEKRHLWHAVTDWKAWLGSTSVYTILHGLDFVLTYSGHVCTTLNPSVCLRLYFWVVK